VENFSLTDLTSAFPRNEEYKKSNALNLA